MADKATMRLLYKRMQIVRRLEYALREQHRQGNVRGPVHLCVGQEATGVGACSVLRDDDYVTSTHRGHAHFVGKGLDLNRMVAEMMGKDTGYCRGKASHMLIADADRGMLGGCGIVAGAMGIAVGYGLAFRMRQTDRVSLCFFGDGASNEGMFHEALNMAALWRTNTVFFAEHNMYGLTVHADRHLSVRDIAARGAAYGIPAEVIDGNDLLAVIEATGRAVERARRGEGPTLIEAKTYRILGFSTGDKGGYQPREEVDAWSAPDRDPLPRFADYLITNELCTEAEVAALDAEAQAEVEAAIAFGLESPWPDPAILEQGIFA